jgi:hypothetical protein
MSRRRLRNVALIVVFGVALGVGGGATYAAFSWTTANGANTLATAPDWTGPTGTTVIAKSGSTTSGTINPGSAYYVYANVTDTGNPASGIATVTANVANITTGQSAAALTTAGGPFTIDGNSYAYRSASLTANAGLTAGSKTYTLTMSDNAGNSGSASGSVTVVIPTGPAAVDIQTTNKAGGTVGRPESGDVITYTFSTAMAPGSIMTGWTGTSASVDVTFGNNACGPANDSLFVTLVGTATPVNLGSVCLGSNYANGNNKTSTSTMVMAGNSVGITLGTVSNSIKTSTTPFAMQWTPVAAATDVSGNACSTTPATESGSPADIDF